VGTVGESPGNIAPTRTAPAVRYWFGNDRPHDSVWWSAYERPTLSNGQRTLGRLPQRRKYSLRVFQTTDH